jgi:hypothetical protein
MSILRLRETSFDLKTAIAFPACQKRINFSLIAVFGAFRKGQFLATSDVSQFKRSLAAFTVIAICIGFSNFKLIDARQRANHQAAPFRTVA